MKPILKSMMLLVMVSVLLTGCSQTPAANSDVDGLEQYKTEYIGDAPKVSAIAQRLPYPKDYSYSSIEIQSDTKPYELIVYLSGGAEVTKEDFTDASAIAFDLIENMEVISYKSEETGAVIASLNRND